MSVSIPDHLREELDWLAAYFLLVKHDRSQAPEQAAAQAKAATAPAPAAAAAAAANESHPSSPANSSLFAKRSTTSDGALTSKTMAAATSTATTRDGPIPFDAFRLQHDAALPVAAVPLGKPRGGKPPYIPRLYQLAQVRGLAPQFEFDENTPQHFGVRLALGELVVEDAGPYRSKKDAKEAVAEKGFFALSARPDVTMVSPCAAAGVEVNADVPQEPWIAILNGERSPFSATTTTSPLIIHAVF
jgi:hypothetical protein